VSELGDETGQCFDHKIARQLDRLSTVSANGLHNLQQIPAIAGARRATFAVIAFVAVFDGLWARVQKCWARSQRTARRLQMLQFSKDFAGFLK
jgi:hypothetical protein